MSNDPLRAATGADLAPLSSFALPARAARLVTLRQPGDAGLLDHGPGPVLVLGGGSNTVFLADYPGTVALNRIRGINLEDLDTHRVRITAGAGEDWHALVLHTLDRGLYGLENLALIPGRVGAAPIQNIGAYGAELSQVTESVEVWDRRQGRLRLLAAEACGFGYRDSRFKSADRGRFVITCVRLVLDRRPRPRTDYPTLAAELQRLGPANPDPRQITAAVIRIRRRRLPSPRRLPNAGSFFANPVVDSGTARRLAQDFPGLPQWPQAEGRIKLAAAWMIEHLGWKGRRLGPVGIYPHHALVLVNLGGARGPDLLALAEQVATSVHEAFGVHLTPEPELVGLPAGSPLFSAPA